MDSALPMFLFFGGLTLFGMLIIWASYQSREIERAEQEAEARAAAPTATPFMASSSATPTAPTVSIDPAVLQRLESYLSQQLEQATAFVDRPSMEFLFQKMEDELFPRLIDRLEAFLRQERQAARDFLSDPTVESLHRRWEVLAA